MKIYVEGALPGLNGIIAVAKKHWSAYAKMKSEHTERFMWETKKFPKYDCPVKITLTWHYKNALRDPDNIAAGAKFILDALVKNGILVDDNVKYIPELHHIYIKDKTDGVDIEIEEANQ